MTIPYHGQLKTESEASEGTRAARYRKASEARSPPSSAPSGIVEPMNACGGAPKIRPFGVIKIKDLNM